ncbi:hypothetical protein BDZ97DRAFT_1900816 [Flammula alnicola]|nr:hypothetical protein BDZ97DRAFT_1900816 [Flammula alnicola]
MGLSNFYDRKKEWNKQAEALVQLLNLFNKTQDAVKCADTLQKLITLYRNYGTKQQLIVGLCYYLPESTVYPLLSTLPPPDPTNPTGTTTFEAQDAIHNGFRVLEEVVSLTEALEEDTFKKEVERRRMRLGAPSPEQLRKEVFMEIYNKSQLPSCYDSVLNHPQTSDELRREVEAKQLRYKQRYLYSIPSTKETLLLKQKISRELDELVDGIVLLQKPDELGWKMFFEGKDCENLSEYDREHVRAYIRLFPDSGLATLFRGYFAYKQETLSEDEDEDEEDIFALNDEDPVDTILNASLSLSDTVYLSEGDYQNAIKTSKQGLQNLGLLESGTAKSLSRTRTGLQVILATSLVHFFSPKHHPEATRILDEILTRSPKNTAALMDRAFILQSASNWNDAAAVFDQVASLLPDDMEVGLRAQEESAWCICQLGRYEEALQVLQQVLDTLNDLAGDGLNSERARCLWRIGKCNMAIGGSNIQSAYKYFINALKQDSEFAPAFTSLGMYYLEHSTPPDPIRSSKCFQKAFELDARETVVAQRTIDGEGGLNAGLQKVELNSTSRYLPTNSWAWKAVGVVKFHYKDYPAAIQAFQISLRVEPDDQPLWVRLGEAYNKAGRHSAALKALNHALEMNPDDWLCSYFIADVNQSMGLFEEAITDEAGILALLAQVHLDLGRSQVSDGFQIRAEESFVNAIDVALDMIQRIPGFRTIAWKVIGDAAFQLSGLSTFVNEANVRHCLQSISFLPAQDIAEQVVNIVPMPLFKEDMPLTGLQVIAVAIHACLSQISLYSHSQTSNSTAWYDLGVALQSWTTKVLPTVETTTAKEKSIEFLKKALQLDVANDIYWVTLGNAYFLSHAKAAQHAYIRALEIDSKNAETWVKLGLLYAYHGDVELANEALYRAQVLDPDNTLAWVGQSLIATANGDNADATLLLEHAVGLATPVAEADYEFASQVFNLTKKPQRVDQVQDALLPSFFLLNRYCQRRPSDPSGLHLLSLVCERLGHLSFGEELVERAIGILETAYEETEDPKLSQGAYEDSVTSFESALGDDLVLRGHITIVLAQTLWAIGTDEAKETAKSRLLECIASDPENLAAINTLAGMGILTNDDGLVDAALSEILALPIEQKHKLDPQRHVDYLLIQHHLSQEDAKQARSIAQHAVHAEPASLGQRNRLATLIVQSGEEEKNDEALAVLGTAAGGGGGAGAASVAGISGEVDAATVALCIQAVAQASGARASGNKEGALKEEEGTDDGLRDALCRAQRAIMMRPSEVRGWQTLAYVRSRMA